MIQVLQFKRTLIMALFSGILLFPVVGLATEWCGENGLIRFSFVEGDSLVGVYDAGPAQGGVTKVMVQAWLTDLAEVALDGEVLLAIGGFELSLEISGAEAFVIGQKFAFDGLNVGPSNGTVAFGLTEGQRIRDGRSLLVTWEVMFQGRPENVRFGLDATKLVSCGNTEGCLGSGTQALYIGPDSSNMLSMVFGAGYVPAWLNPTEDPDLTPVTGTDSWQDVGLFEAR